LETARGEPKEVVDGRVKPGHSDLALYGIALPLSNFLNRTGSAAKPIDPICLSWAADIKLDGPTCAEGRPGSGFLARRHTTGRTAMGPYRSRAYRSLAYRTRLHRSLPRWAGCALALSLLAACAAPTATTPSPTLAPPPLAAGMARVWFLRQADPPGGNIYAAVPTVYVDRAPLVQIAQGTAFFHDFPPGRYRLSAQAFGTYAGQHDILHLDAGTQTYVQVIAVANWELGSPVGGWSFAVLPMSADLAGQYLPTLADLGPR
jgi:hypothetical protein